jgi:hypothetical protein
MQDDAMAFLDHPSRSQLPEAVCRAGNEDASHLSQPDRI